MILIVYTDDTNDSVFNDRQLLLIKFKIHFKIVCNKLTYFSQLDFPTVYYTSVYCILVYTFSGEQLWLILSALTYSGSSERLWQLWATLSALTYSVSSDLLWQLWASITALSYCSSSDILWQLWATLIALSCFYCIWATLAALSYSGSCELLTALSYTDSSELP